MVMSRSATQRTAWDASFSCRGGMSEEYKARSGLISDEEWLKIKDWASARDDGVPDSALLRTTIAAAAADRPAFDQARYRVW